VFHDARDNGRTMEVSWHSEEGFLIVSLWHGSICRATFRLPIEESPALIQAIADAQGDADRSMSTPERTDRPSRPETRRQRVRKHIAEIVTLREHPKP
jgi:hypothetical protein